MRIARLSSQHQGAHLEVWGSLCRQSIVLFLIFEDEMFRGKSAPKTKSIKKLLTQIRPPLCSTFLEGKEVYFAIGVTE